MAIKDVAALQPGDTIRYRGQCHVVEGVTPGRMGYTLHLDEFPVYYHFGTRLIVVDEADAVSEAERIIEDAD